jgi:outer membrane protein assembly factor BamA
LDARDRTRRLLRIDAIDVDLDAQLLDPATSDLRLYLGAAFRRRETRTGVGAEPGLVRDGALAIPGGFEEELHYPVGRLRLELDTRDSRGRTTRGVVASLEGAFTADVEDAGTSVFRGSARVALFAPVLPLHRVLFLSLGASAAVPLRGDEVPLHELVHLGGGGSLRGYDSDRFAGAVGWWGSAEYRYKVFQEADTGHGLSGALFLDVGATARSLEAVLLAPVRWSAGFALRVETNLFLLGRLQLGFSPEGVQVTLAVGELP